MYLTLQNLTGDTLPIFALGRMVCGVLDQNSAKAQAGSWLEIEISKNGGTIKTQRTDAPHGVISLKTAPQATGSQVSTELQVEGGSPRPHHIHV